MGTNQDTKHVLYFRIGIIPQPTTVPTPKYNHFQCVVSAVSAMERPFLTVPYVLAGQWSRTPAGTGSG